MPCRTLYGGGSGSISISFGDDDQIYDFPKALLTKNFLYFRLALRTQDGEAIYTEGERHQVHFEDIGVKTFATLHKWASDKATNNCDHLPYHWVFADKKEREVNHLLQIAIAADYLGLDHFKELEKFLNQGFALSTLTDRRVVTQRVLDLIKTHQAFKSQLIWRTVVKAGVRPALQEHMLGLEENTAASAPRFGLREGYEAWDAVLKHCRKLRARRRNIEYAAAILNEITVTLMAGSLRGQRRGSGENGALLLRDPLRDVYKEEPYGMGEVEHDFTM
jgi:hypothetical protein